MDTRAQRIEQVCQQFRVKTLYVFGSRSAEVFRFIQDDSLELTRSRSDLDLGVFTQRALSIDEKVDLTLQLEEFFGEPRVDLLILQEADPFLAANIIRGERLFAEDSYFADEYELFVLRRAGDLAGFERERMSMILKSG